MARWQGPARLLLGIFVIAFGVVVYRSIGTRPPRAPDEAAKRMDPEAAVESSKGEVILFKGSKQDVRIEYQTRVTYQSGRTKFFGAKVAVAERAGRSFEATGNEAEVADNQSKIDMRGNVVLTASDGLVVKANEATYTQSNETMHAPGPVTFTRARMTGTSIGATYDRARDVLWLLDQAHIVVTPDEKGQGGVDVTAGAAGYARKDRYMRFERAVKMLRGTQGLEAANAVAYLRPTEDKLETLELRGNSRVTGVGSGPNSLQAMSARDMNLSYAEDGQTLQRANLIGDGVMQLSNATGGPGQRLAAQTVNVEIGPDGNSLVGLDAQTRVQFDIPATPDTPTRQIKSVSLDARAEPGQTALSRARFVDQVEFRETRPATATEAAVERIVHSKVLNAKVQAGFSQIDEAVFEGGATVKDGAKDATGPTMTYNVAKGQIALTGPVVAGRPGTRVNDERATIEAQRVDWTTDGKGMIADGDVKSVLKGQKPGAAGKPAAPGAKPGARAADDIKRPAILKDDEPTNVTAKHLVYNSETGHADYTGGAWLWQGDTSIKADQITIDDESGNLTASGSVNSRLRLEQSDDEATGKGKPPAQTNGGAAGTPAGAGPGTTAKGAAGAASPVPTPGAGAGASAAGGAAGSTAKPGAAAAGSKDGAGKGAKADGPRKSSMTIATAKDMVYIDAERKATYTTEAHVVSEEGDLKADKVELFLDETGRGLERLEAYKDVIYITKTMEGGIRRGIGDRLTYFAEEGRYIMSGVPVNVVEKLLTTECRETTGRTLTFYRSTDSITFDGKDQSRTQSKTGAKCPEQFP